MNQIEELKRLLNNLEKNDRVISEHDKATKYKKSYNKLKADVCRQISAIMPAFIFSGIKFDPNDKDTVSGIVEKIKTTISKSKRRGDFDRVKETAFTTYDLDKIVAAMEPIHDAVVAEVYGDYWLSKCQKIAPNSGGYTYYNSIVDMFYSPELNMWMKENKGGSPVFSILFPPTKEQMNQVYPLQE